MTTSLQLKIGVDAPHRNRYLFSDHYLETLLPEDSRWGEALHEAEAFCDWLRTLYADEGAQLPHYNEDQLRDHWFNPILRELSHVFEREAGVPGLEAHVKRPDYVFFPDEAARQAAASFQNQEAYAAQALAVGEVKAWDTPLGKKRPGGGPSFEDQNPSWQIDTYLRITGLDWGILSNGRLWRLVHKESSHRLNRYYEVDLVDLLQRDDPGLMRYFTLFFRQASFRPDAQRGVLLDDVLAGSNAYAVALGEDVEQNVYRALEILMQAYLDLGPNGLGANDLERVHQNSLYVLYRLLFILYGESRGLLPMDQEGYREHYSLEAMKHDIVAGRVPPFTASTVLWGRLYNLFHIINGDDPRLNREVDVPRYNGGLFDPLQHPFLEKKKVGDQPLAEVIDLLSRRETKGGREFVDYRTLTVRHLGSIYEGLLEYQPRLAEEPMAAVGDAWLPAAEAGEDAKVVDRREPGEVYLITDRGERKATGSYYTPQYIVEYIVDRTLGPLVKGATERIKENLAENENLRKNERQVRGGERLVEAILALKCLDPAMGSGHFLVEATEYLARALATDPYVETEAGEEDLTYWKRRVAERCIYGVDKNPLAVELAKLSLWLATVAADRPLSFLDHHLKCGDSLIGARVEDLGEVPPVMLGRRALREREARYEAGVRQANLFETRLIEKLPVVMGRIMEIMDVESKDYDTVRAKEAADRAVQELKAPFEAVADLWTSAYSGNEFVNGAYDQALMSIGQPEQLMEQEAVRRAREMAEERRFFHWELAFPEVFYDEQGKRRGERAGFDAVVGNPPYSSKQSTETKLLTPFFDLIDFRCDPFALFFERSLTLARDKGYVGLIVPATWTGNASYEQLRRELVNTRSLQGVVLFDGLVFADANVDTSIVMVHKRAVEGREFKMVIAAPGSLENLTAVNKRYEVIELSDRFDIPRTVTHQWDELIVKLYGCSRRLSEITSSISLGLRLASIAEYTFQRAGPAHSDPLFLGDEIARYGALVPQTFFNSAEAPIVGGTKNPLVYEASPKILLQSIRNLSLARRLVPTLDRHGYYFGGNVVGIVLSENPLSVPYILALLASTLLNEFFAHRFTTISMTSTFLGEIPTRRIEFTTPEDEREELLETGITQAAAWTEAAARPSSAESASFSAFSGSTLGRWLDERFSAEPEQADVVHDLLGHLAERMIAMHQERQERIERFWLDLEGVTDAETFEDLREHGKWEQSLWRASEACRPFVGEESRSTRHLDESLGWNEACFKVFVKELTGTIANLSDVVQVYRRHYPEVRALLGRIAATDRLIDLIVYRLYGLTEEEVAVVEGEGVSG